MKKTAHILILLIYTTISFGQKHQDANLIELDSTWGKEMFRFPARNMNYEGLGEVRFPPKGWRDVNHKNFWSYTYAWDINLNRAITAKEVAGNLEKYFNSLNNVDRNATTDSRIASAMITKINSKKATTYFKGFVKTYDRFATNENITLNVLIESHFCEKEKKTIMLFKFSPKEFTHETWSTTLKKVTLYDNLCEQ